MTQFRAAWLVPISQPPVRDGWVRIEGGRIAALGPCAGRGGTPPNEVDLGDVAVLPGLVNAHTHLELSWMRGRIPPTHDFPGWIRDVIALQRSGDGGGHASTVRADTTEPGIPATDSTAALRAAIAEARATGTVLVGDVSNTLASVEPLAQARLPGIVFHELIGFRHEQASAVMEAARQRARALPRDFLDHDLRYSLAAHAPYSVSPALFTAIHEARGSEPFARCTVHLGESAAEVNFLRDGSGPWRRLLEDLGSWDPAWEAPDCRPVEYLERLNFLDARTLVVHGVQLREQELARLAGRGATLVTCPRGNRLTGAGAPPVSSFYSSGVPVAVGTDSLASVPDLNLFSEIAELRRLAPDVPASSLLESATLTGARALGFEAEYGSIEPGKRAALIAVATSSKVRDLAEHLVSGVPPADISIVNGLLAERS